MINPNETAKTWRASKREASVQLYLSGVEGDAAELVNARVADFPLGLNVIPVTDWIDPEELSYFRTRITQAPRDSEHGLEVVRRYCVTPETQAAALSALSFKCDVLWSMLDAIDQAYGTHR